MSTESFPEPIRLLLRTLDERGYRVVREVGGGVVNHVIELEDGRVGVRVAADRGEWSIEAGSAGAADLFDADVWDAFDSGQPADSSPLEEQVEYLVANLAWIGDVAGDEAGAALREIRQQRVYGRLGLPMEPID